MIKILQENISAIIGVSGTLLGTILGFFLHQIVRIGKIKVFKNKVDYELFIRNSAGGFHQVESITDKVVKLSVTFDIDVLNTSDYSRQVMRDIKLVIQNKKIEQNHTFINEKTREFNGILSVYDKLQNINLNPRELRNLELSVSFNKDIELILNSNWFLEYKNLKNKALMIRLKKTRYNSRA